MNKPDEIVALLASTAVRYSHRNLVVLFLLSITAGMYIGIGGLVASSIAGNLTSADVGIKKLVFGSVFPMGLFLVVGFGSELFTSNVLYFICGTLTRRVSWTTLGKHLLVSYVGNFLGSLLVAGLFARGGHLVTDVAPATFLCSIAQNKILVSWGTVFSRGIGANWLVCLGTWMASSSKSAEGKYFSLWWPIMAFSSLGMDHSIANQSLIPMALMVESFIGGCADVNIGNFFTGNLIPSTLGNVVGGGVFVGCIAWYCHASVSDENILVKTEHASTKLQLNSIGQETSEAVDLSVQFETSTKRSGFDVESAITPSYQGDDELESPDPSSQMNPTCSPR